MVRRRSSEKAASSGSSSSISLRIFRVFPTKVGTYECKDAYVVKNSPSTLPSGFTLDANRQFTKFVTASTLKPQ